MIKYLIFVLVLMKLTSYGQIIAVNYSITGSGTNITSVISKEINNHEIGFGIGYNINSIKQRDDQSQITYQRLYATKPMEHLNFELFYKRKIFTQLECIHPFVFFDSQFKYSTTRSSMYIAYAYDSSIVSSNPEDMILYRNFIQYFGPFLWIETYVGTGFDVQIFNGWYLRQRIGFGGISIIGEDYRIGYSGYNWEFAGIFSLGIGYSFKK